MSRGDLVAREVELWDRTPFDPQQACRGAGVDCKGLPWGVARDLGFPEADSFYATFIGYDLGKRKTFPHDLLLEGMAALFDPVDVRVEGDGRGLKLIGAKPGDILLLKANGKPAHMAIVSRNEGRAWHAQIEPNDYVKEASLRSLLHPSMFPLHSVWRWRD